MKKFIKITAVVGAIIVVLGIVCIVAGISKGGSNIVKEEIGKNIMLLFQKKNVLENARLRQAHHFLCQNHLQLFNGLQ